MKLAYAFLSTSQSRFEYVEAHIFSHLRFLGLCLAGIRAVSLQSKSMDPRGLVVLKKTKLFKGEKKPRNLRVNSWLMKPTLGKQSPKQLEQGWCDPEKYFD